MSGTDGRDLFFAAVVSPLARGGRRGRQAAARLDLVRETGLRYATRRLRDREAWELLDEGRRLAYERIWRDAAAELGADVEDLSHAFLEIRKGEAATRVWHQWVALDDAVTLRLALDKAIVHRLLAAASVPIPEHVEVDFRNGAAALEFLARAGAPCVVKPASGTGGGVGLTCGIERPLELRRAILRASRQDPRILLERQSPGPVYRLLFLDGELLDVVRRDPPRVVGDGRANVEELIARENRRRLHSRGEAGFEPLTIDLDSILTLERAGLRLSSVPRAGDAVAVKTTTNQNRVEDNETVGERPGDDLVAEASAAVAAVGLRLAGVDVVTTDLGRSLRASGGTVIEVNGTPGLHHHYHVADRANATRVAVPILRTLLAVH